MKRTTKIVALGLMIFPLLTISANNGRKTNKRGGHAKFELNNVAQVFKRAVRSNRLVRAEHIKGDVSFYMNQVIRNKKRKINRLQNQLHNLRVNTHPRNRMVRREIMVLKRKLNNQRSMIRELKFQRKLFVENQQRFRKSLRTDILELQDFQNTMNKNFAPNNRYQNNRNNFYPRKRNPRRRR